MKHLLSNGLMLIFVWTSAAVRMTSRECSNLPDYFRVKIAQYHALTHDQHDLGFLAQVIKSTDFKKIESLKRSIYSDLWRKTECSWEVCDPEIYEEVIELYEQFTDTIRQNR